jgi:hypothetical protein
VVGVTTATEDEISQADPKIEFPCALDPKGAFMATANISMLPCVLLIDTNHMVRYEGHPAALTTNVLQDLLMNSSPAL